MERTIRNTIARHVLANEVSSLSSRGRPRLLSTSQALEACEGEASIRKCQAERMAVVYYWQFEDVDNGDGCGKAWGIVNLNSCQWI